MPCSFYALIDSVRHEQEELKTMDAAEFSQLKQRYCNLINGSHEEVNTQDKSNDTLKLLSHEMIKKIVAELQGSNFLGNCIATGLLLAGLIAFIVEANTANPEKLNKYLTKEVLGTAGIGMLMGGMVSGVLSFVTSSLKKNGLKVSLQRMLYVEASLLDIDTLKKLLHQINPLILLPQSMQKDLMNKINARIAILS